MSNKIANKEQENMMKKQQEKIRVARDQSLLKIVKLVGVLLIVFCAIAYKISISQKESLESSLEAAIKYALIGDIGGTNIRYQLVSFTVNQNQPIQIIKQQRLKVVDFDSFQASITHFLSNILASTYPDTAVIAIAGPVQQNAVVMPNIPKWEIIDGNKLAPLYNLSSFLIINDFEAASYGLLIIEKTQLVKLNGLDVDSAKIRGVIGPGTGLGHSIILRNQFVQDGFTVLPSEAGHSDVPFIDDQTSEYIDFLQNKLGEAIDLEKTFCGPSIPLMYEFYFKKLYSNITFIQKDSPQIVQQCIKETPGLIYRKVFQLFMKFYSSAIANFMVQHMTTGGVYLIGDLTKALLTKIKDRDALKDWKERHPDMVKIVDKIPLIFSNQTDLGLKGSFFMAKRLISHRASKDHKSIYEDIV